jgi:hypothetical protein
MTNGNGRGNVNKERPVTLHNGPFGLFQAPGSLSILTLMLENGKPVVA